MVNAPLGKCAHSLHVLTRSLWKWWGWRKVGGGGSTGQCLQLYGNQLWLPTGRVSRRRFIPTRALQLLLTQVPHHYIRSYESARALLRKTTQEHDYQLVVLDALDESGLEERSYLLSKEIKFQLLPAGSAGSPILTWLDLASGDGAGATVVELMAGNAGQMLALHQFELAVIQCVWSRANQKSWDAATDEQLDAVKKEM